MTNIQNFKRKSIVCNLFKSMVCHLLIKDCNSWQNAVVLREINTSRPVIGKIKNNYNVVMTQHVALHHTAFYFIQNNFVIFLINIPILRGKYTYVDRLIGCTILVTL